MKYVVRFCLDKPEFCLDYRRTIISYFKKAISLYQRGRFFKEIYDSGAYQKALVWSIKFQNPKFNSNIIELGGDEIEMTIKIPDAETAFIYYSSLMEMKGKPFSLENGNSMILKSIKMHREQTISQELVGFKILSPICLKRHLDSSNKDWFISFGDSDFLEEMERKLLEDLPKYEQEIKSLKFNTDMLKKIVVKAYGTKIPVTIGTLIVEGDNFVLNHILKNGLGSKRNSGFGLLEAIIQTEGQSND